MLDYEFYQELVLVNNLFKDYYTGFAVLVGKYLEKVNKLSEIKKKTSEE